jgi:RNA polymerase sigma-70 factor, ECF subfamily
MNATIFGGLYAKHRERLLGRMIAMTRNRDFAEDITDAALARALEKLQSFRGNSSFETWLHAIAVNEVRYWRRQQGAFEVSIDAPTARDLAEPDAVARTLDKTECCQGLRKALRHLPTAYRRVLVDHFVSGYSVKRIAHRRRVPIGTVLSRLFTAKRMLRRAWEA